MIKNCDHSNLICGNDAEAKMMVDLWLMYFGWKSEILPDVSDI